MHLINIRFIKIRWVAIDIKPARRNPLYQAQAMKQSYTYILLMAYINGILERS